MDFKCLKLATCLPGQAAESLPTSSLATSQPSPSNGTPTPAACYAPASLDCGLSSKTSAMWTFNAWLESMRCALDSLAPTSVPPTQAGPVSAASDPASTGRLCEQSTLFDLSGYSSKTAQESGSKVGTSSSLTLWREDIPGATESLARLMLERPINVTAGGYLPTPTATTAKQGFRSMAGGASQGRPLLAMAALMWPTPAATDHKTPYRGKALEAQQAKRSKPLRDAVSAPAGYKLNPLWTEWLMLWPLGHTATGPAVSAVLGTVKSPSPLPLHGGSWEARK